LRSERGQTSENIPKMGGGGANLAFKTEKQKKIK
jgi:hypothetical protein